MDAEEFVNELWDVLALDTSDSDKVILFKEKIQEWADEVGHALTEIEELEDDFDEQ